MFCGLPVMVAALPMLLAVARPSSSGMGSTSAISAASIIRGVSARHTTSLMKNAARRPDAATVIASMPKPDRARPSKARATNANAPDRRRFATTIIIPSSRAIV